MLRCLGPFLNQHGEAAVEGNGEVWMGTAEAGYLLRANANSVVARPSAYLDLLVGLAAVDPKDETRPFLQPALLINRFLLPRSLLDSLALALEARVKGPLTELREAAEKGGYGNPTTGILLELLRRLADAAAVPLLWDLGPPLPHTRCSTFLPTFLRWSHEPIEASRTKWKRSWRCCSAACAKLALQVRLAFSEHEL